MTDDLICDECKKNEGVITYSDSSLNYFHGYYKILCRKCYIELLEDKIKTMKQTIKEQKKLL